MQVDPDVVQCLKCRHYMTGEVSPCPGFPDGIPDEILKGDHDHRIPWEGDHGIRFEPDPALQPEEGGEA